MAVKPTLEIPARGKCRWLMEILGLAKAEMAQALDVTHTTLTRYLEDEEDAVASRDVKFDRLLKLTQVAKGSIRPEKLREWMREPNPRLGRLTPAKILGDDEGFQMVLQALHDDKYGNPL